MGTLADYRQWTLSTPIWLVFVAGALITVLATVWPVVRRIRRLRDAERSIKSGFATEVPVDGRDEIVQLNKLVLTRDPDPTKWSIKRTQQFDFEAANGNCLPADFWPSWAGQLNISGDDHVRQVRRTGGIDGVVELDIHNRLRDFARLDISAYVGVRMLDIDYLSVAWVLCEARARASSQCRSA